MRHCGIVHVIRRTVLIAPHHFASFDQHTRTARPRAEELRTLARADEALEQVHAGVLGAAALVAAFPYDVPDWMPTLVLDTLAPHSESPAPVSHTVRQCASEFRRTHQDTWMEDQHKFGERVQEVHDFTLGRSDYFV